MRRTQLVGYSPKLGCSRRLAGCISGGSTFALYGYISILYSYSNCVISLLVRVTLNDMFIVESLTYDKKGWLRQLAPAVRVCVIVAMQGP